MTMQARLSEFAVTAGYLLNATAVDANSVISRSASRRREMEPWKGSLRGNRKLQLPQICLAFQSQASWRSGAGIRSVEKDGEVFSVKTGDLTRQERFARTVLSETLYLAAWFWGEERLREPYTFLARRASPICVQTKR